MKKNKPHLWQETLRTQMATQGFNARSLSLQAGLNPTAVRDMLEGRTRFPRYDTVQALAKVLHITPSQLMEDVPANENTDSLENMDLLVEIITRLQEEAASMGQKLDPKNFAAMAAAIYRQMKNEEDTSDISPKIRNLITYEAFKQKAAN